MQYTSARNRKAVIIYTLQTLGNEIWKLFWKCGVWFLVLLFVVSSRLFYEMVYNPDVSIRKLLALGGLSFSTGTVAMLVSVKWEFGNWTFLPIIIFVMASYRTVEYFVTLDSEKIGTWFQGILTNAINFIGKKKQ